MDEFERAALHEEEERRIAIQQHADRRRKAAPREDCADCGEPLADHRKPYGTCIECQTDRELRARHHRRD